MVLNGKGGGNTKTGLIFEGKTDLETFLSKQNGYSVKSQQETVLFKGKKQKITVRNVYYNNDKVAELYKKNEFYAVLLKKLNIEWEPEDFELEMTTHWSFPKRGDWATHDAKWRGNWSPYIPRNILLRYSKEGDLVLDQFAGGGTTLVEAKLLNRNIIGVDVNDAALARCREKVDFEHSGADGKVYIHKGDARNLNFLSNESIDLICTHPPYADIIKYSEDIPEDLSLLKVKDFLEEMKKVASECYRVLKKDKFCAVLMGDTRQKGCMIPMSFDVMGVFEDAGFKLKELIIKEQHNCKATGYWKTNSVKYNFLLIAHEYLFVFKK